MNIRIFNPEHDIALASNMERFTAPHAGRQLRGDLGYLPAFWAEEGDVVIVDDIDFAESAYRRVKAERKPKVEFCTMEQIAHILRSSAVVPDIDLWGWDLAIRFQLLKAGVPESCLPSKEAVNELRRLSGRQCTTDILKKVRTDIESNTCGESLYISDYKLFFIEDELPKNSLNWASNVIQQQGGVMVEPLYNKVKDFGMEFRRCADGSVKYLGLSLFHTLNGAYTGNLLATENVKREMMSKYISLDLLDEVTSRLERELTVLFSSLPSEKPLRSINLGVDMMIVTKDDCDGFLLHPCVEINLRRTMGHVALALSPTDDTKEGAMAINYESKRYHLRLK